MSTRSDIATMLAKFGAYAGAVKVVACGTTSAGVIVPLRVDEDGNLIVHSV
jgi:hypothetical protein